MIGRCKQTIVKGKWEITDDDDVMVAEICQEDGDIRVDVHRYMETEEAKEFHKALGEAIEEAEK